MIKILGILTLLVGFSCPLCALEPEEEQARGGEQFERGISLEIESYDLGDKQKNNALQIHPPFWPPCRQFFVPPQRNYNGRFFPWYTNIRCFLLDYVEFSGSIMERAYLDGSEGFRPSFGEWLGRTTNLTEAELTYVRFTDADFTKADLTRAKLNNSWFTGRRTSFRGAILEDADAAPVAFFDFADFEGANLAGGNFIGASFRDCRLKGAVLSRTNLSNANLKGADLTGLPDDKEQDDKLLIESGAILNKHTVLPSGKKHQPPLGSPDTLRVQPQGLREKEKSPLPLGSPDTLWVQPQGLREKEKSPLPLEAGK